MKPQEAQRDWTDGRPIIKENNDLPTLIELLFGELREFAEDPNKTELADILIFAYSIANLMGWDAEEIVMEKIALNHLRYPANKFQHGDYNEARKECKDNENSIIKEFYESS